MAFRGSDNAENWLRDFEFWRVAPKSFKDCAGCKVHTGFNDVWENVRDLVLKALQEVGCSPTHATENLLYVTGHSLGAALTHLAMFTLEDAGFTLAKTYSFEAPRVGNKAFSTEFSKRFSRKFPVYRITHNKDPVVHLPPTALGYTHVQEEVYYPLKGNYKLCPKVEDPSCADQHWDIPGMLAFDADQHCTTPLVPNGNICYPLGCGTKDGTEHIVV